jgi:hypothetical protein
MAPMEYLGAWGTLIHERNLKSKTSCQTPFKECSPFKTYATGPDAYREHPGQEHDAFAEHTQQELTRTLSIHISFFCVCSAKA